MARAHSIWLVAWNNYDGLDPRAAFTVKHEMISWLKEQSPHSLTGCSVLRIPDGGSGEEKQFRIDELLSASDQ